MAGPRKPRKPAALEAPYGGAQAGEPGNKDLSAYGIAAATGAKSPTDEQWFDDVPDFSGVEVTKSQNSLDMLASMADTLREKLRKAEETAATAKEAADDLSHFQLIVLPEAMEQAGMTEFKLKDGAQLKVKPDLKAGISEANRAAAHAWLREHEHGSVIKTYLEVDVRSFDDEERQRLIDTLNEEFEASFEAKESIHNATLKSLMKELLEKGTDLPPCFSIHEFKKAELKEPKGK